MALSPTLITTQIRLAAPKLSGPDWIKLSSSLGKAIYGWVINPANVQLQGVTTGIVGGGSVPTGKVIVVPLVPAVLGSFIGSNLKGVESVKIAKATAIGTAAAINLAGEYYGASAGVGVGSDISKVIVANSKVLQGILQGVFSASILTGSDCIRLSKGVSLGVSSILMTGGGVGGVVGGGGPLPSGGTSKCFIR